MLTEYHSFKSSQKHPSIGVIVIGEMNTGKSTFNNALLGKEYSATSLCRQTLTQSFFSYDKAVTGKQMKNIRCTISNHNKLQKEAVSKLNTIRFPIKTPQLSKLLATYKCGFELIDTVGFNDPITDPSNYKWLDKNLNWIDTVFFITAPDK